MKNTIRVHKNGSEFLTASQAETFSKANTLLETELLAVAENWGSQKRSEISKKFARWAMQLQASSKQMIQATISEPPNKTDLFGKFELTDTDVANVLEEIVKLNDAQRLNMAATLGMMAEFIQEYVANSNLCLVNTNTVSLELN